MMIELIKLPYAYDALEPVISKETIEYHHDKHHQAYVNKLNELIEGTELADMHPCEILKNLDKAPADKKQAIINQGGGVYNHNVYWKQLAKDGQKEPKGELKEAIDKAFGSFEEFKEKFEKAGSGQFGSGWTWLVEKDGKLEIMTTANQDAPISKGYKVLLNNDVWEHAYYVDYRNKRAEYLKKFWDIVDWSVVEERFAK
ncbi:MAG: superoxide dismutase [Ezakiella sp.]|uniref:superoxide dismutase n=1 Tax=Ezakiella sp. TaxID=1935205 RepID=UPI002A919D08|nr:superoxide dismutase [Ezakiella sp.]MDY6079592.1 superoxide dismutase [Ezakiella sp.]